LIGSPLTVVGLKTHLDAAATAAGRKAWWPLMALASMTLPVSEMVTCTLTIPNALIILAVGG